MEPILGSRVKKRLNRGRELSRRRFVAESAAMAAGTSLVGCFPEVGGRWPEERDGCFGLIEPAPGLGSSDVVEVHDAASVSADAPFTIQPAAVQTMLADGLMDLTGVGEPWTAILPDYGAGMRIGLKVNCLNPLCPTTTALTRAVVEGLNAQLGVPLTDIIVWDRRDDELAGCGFTSQAVGGARVLGTIASITDSSGPGYEEATCEVVPGKVTRLSRIMTEMTDVTINLPVLKTHGISGVTAALKNLYGVIDNPEDFHDDLNTALPALYALAPIRSRLRFAVVDSLIAVTTGGTSSPADTVPRRILLSADSVAMDAHALDLVNRLRDERGAGLRAVDSKYTAWLDNAQAQGRGSANYDLRVIAR